MTTTFTISKRAANRLRQKYSKPMFCLPNGIRINGDVFWSVIYPTGLMTPEEFFDLPMVG